MVQFSALATELSGRLELAVAVGPDLGLAAKQLIRWMRLGDERTQAVGGDRHPAAQPTGSVPASGWATTTVLASKPGIRHARSNTTIRPAGKSPAR